MLCDICAKNTATVHLTEIINNEMRELHLCELCAQEKRQEMEQQFGLSELLAGLADINAPLKAKGKDILKCPNCGLSYEDFRKIGRLGCSECYTTFKDSLIPLLKKIHGASKHSGAGIIGQPLSKKKTQIEILKERLQAAIKEEAFEEAARLRDKIKELEGK